MATTSIWRVGGRLGKIIDYAENPEKTTNPSVAHPSVAPDCERDLSDVINYAMQQRKTVKESGDEEQPVMLRFVSGVNCHPDTAGEEMLMVKRRFGKEGGTLAYHGYQSFAPGEATPELAHEIGIKLAQRLWGDRYQVLVATHRIMVPHCPILSTKLKRLAAEQVSFTLSAASFFLVTAQQPPAYPTSLQYEIILPNLE